MTSPKQWHGLFLNSDPFIRKTTTQEKDSTVRILKHGYEAEACLHHRDQEDCIRRLREVATHWPHRPSPRTVRHHVERSPPSLWFLQWEKSTRATPTPALWVALQEALFWSCTTRTVGESGEFNHWKSDGDREVGEGWQEPTHESWQTEFMPVVTK